jgi:hypothetical protein
MSIPFRQYLRPDARRREVKIDMPQEVELLAQEFIDGGGRFECEELRTGEASLTAVHDVEGEPADIAIEVVPNGPEVPPAVERLVRRASAWLRDNE